MCVDDIGVFRGFSALDFFRIYNKKPFYLKEHYQRFTKSSKILGLKIPVTEKELGDILDRLVKKSRCTNAHVRMILIGGKTKGGLDPSNPNFKRGSWTY